MPLLFALVLMASSARSVVETQVETGEAQIYQSVETTVDGQTIKKESSQPGKLELEMEKTGGGESTVSFSQETPEIISLTPTLMPTETGVFVEPRTFVSPIIEFFQKLLSSLTSLFR